MPTLGNHQHEKFCQEAHRLIWTSTKRKDALDQAYQAAGYQTTGEVALSANARKLANRADVKARLAELNEFAATMAGLDAGWAMLKLKRRVELIDAFNIDDYMTPRRDGEPRGFDISSATRDQLARLSECSLEQETELVGDKEDPETLRIRKTRIKGYLDITAPIKLMAEIAGWKAPDKVQHSGGLTLESLVSQSYDKPPEPKKVEAA